MGGIFAACAFGLLAAVGADGPAPEVSISLRGVADRIVEQGEPLRIAVRLGPARGDPSAIELAPANGTWSEAIQVEIVPALGGPAVARAVVVGESNAPVAMLDRMHVAGGLWFFPTAVMQRVSPGGYVVRARLAIAGGSGWKGEVISAPSPVQVVATANSADRRVQRAVNKAHEALIGGLVEDAAKIIDALLATSPDDARLLNARALIAERGGNPVAALICFNRARLSRSATRGGPPPIDADDLQVRVMASIFGDRKPPENPPAWTWPPLAVLRVPADKFPPAPRNVAMTNGETTPVAKSPPTATSGTATPSPAPRPAPPSPAPPAAARPPAARDSTPAKPGEASAGVIVPATDLTDAKILGDTQGQWAASAMAGSQYGRTGYSAVQATGAPNVPVVGNSPDAWCPAVRDRGTDWLEVTFAKPVYAVEVRVRQNDASGAIAKIEAIEPDGTMHVWWEGVDPHSAKGVREIVWFAVRVPRTDYLVAKVKLTLNLASGPGYKEIDAVQLVAAQGEK